MSYTNFASCAKQQLPATKAVYKIIDKAYTLDENYGALQTAFRSLSIIHSTMKKTKNNIKHNVSPSYECIYFEVAFFNLQLTLNFMSETIITPINKPELLEKINSVISHLEKSVSNNK